MKKLYKSIIFIAIGILFIFLLFNLIFVDIISYEYDVNIKDGTAGINVDNDKLHFGTISSIGVSKRPLRIEYAPSKSKVIIKAYGDLSKYISTTENNFIIDEGQIKEIEFIMDLAGSNAENGKYNGKIVLFFIRGY